MDQALTGTFAALAVVLWVLGHLETRLSADDREAVKTVAFIALLVLVLGELVLP